ncbi:hypothetical protein LA360_24085 [Enterocloster clostridioformis]|nr:hypothetical protein [Enterocloster clostridioformis]
MERGTSMCGRNSFGSWVTDKSLSWCFTAFKTAAVAFTFSSISPSSQNIQGVGGVAPGIDFSMSDAGDDSGIKSAALQSFSSS